MDPALQKMIENLENITGKNLAHWINVVKKSGIVKHGAIVKMLKEEYKIGHGYANMIVHMTKESAAYNQDNDSLVDSQYQGKEQLKTIFDKLAPEIQALGSDVEMVPKKNSVSFRRKRQFALIQPSTKTRIDLGLKFNDRPHGGRLETSGPFGTMCTHRIQITDIKQLDDELMGYIKEAYDEA